MSSKRRARTSSARIHLKQRARQLISITWSAAVVDFRLGADGAEAAVARLRGRKVPFMFYTGFPTEAITATAPVVNKPAHSGLVLETLARILARS
jgi:L-cysteine desulfidase